MTISWPSVDRAKVANASATGFGSSRDSLFSGFDVVDHAQDHINPVLDRFQRRLREVGHRREVVCYRAPGVRVRRNALPFSRSSICQTARSLVAIGQHIIVMDVRVQDDGQCTSAEEPGSACQRIMNEPMGYGVNTVHNYPLGGDPKLTCFGPFS